MICKSFGEYFPLTIRIITIKLSGLQLDKNPVAKCRKIFHFSQVVTVKKFTVDAANGAGTSDLSTPYINSRKIFFLSNGENFKLVNRIKHQRLNLH